MPNVEEQPQSSDAAAGAANATATVSEGVPPLQEDPTTLSSQDGAVATTSWRAPPVHSLLADENAKDIILRFHLQRSFLKRSIEQCAVDGVYLPPMLVEALRCILTDDVPPAAVFSNESNESVVSALQASVSATSQSRQKQEISAMLRERCAASVHGGGHYQRSANGNASLRASSVASDRDRSSRPESPQTDMSVDAHIDMSQHAITQHPQHAASILREQDMVETERRLLAAGEVPPPRVTKTDMRTPKLLLEEAFQARRCGDRRREIQVLVDYLHRGREGTVLLDTSATMRILRQVGDAHTALQEFVSAEQYYFDWYLIAEKVGESDEAAKALTLLGNAAHARGDLRSAEEWLTKARWRVAGTR